MLNLPDLTIVIPFAIPDADQLPLLTESKAIPLLKNIIRRIDAYHVALEANIFTPDVAYERWLAQQLGCVRLPQASLMLVGSGDIETQQYGLGWTALQPVHLHTALDHLVLTAPAKLNLAIEESQALFEVAQPILSELSSRVLAPTPALWYMGDEQVQDVLWCSPVRTIGRNIDMWMPSGTKGKLWRQLHNEIQMLWHEHPVNLARLNRGQLPVNALWLFGSGALPGLPLAFPFDYIFANDALLLGIGRSADKSVTKLPDNFQQMHTAWRQAQHPPLNSQMLVWLDALITPAIEQDGAVWLSTLAEYEQSWLYPAYQALCQRHLQRLRLVLMSEQGCLTLIPQASDRWKFWRQREISSVFTHLTT
jgi:hypothetical protein